MPPFLKLPTNSFFFVSTEITGMPRSMQFWAFALMCSNCASRSGCCVPSTDLFGAWRLYPCSRSSLATVLSLIRIPCCANSSAASTCVLLHVQRSGDSGSPRVTGSTSFSSAGHTSGCDGFIRSFPGTAPNVDHIIGPRAGTRLVAALAHRTNRHTRRSRYCDHAASTDSVRLRASPESPCSLIQRRLQQAPLLANRLLCVHGERRSFRRVPVDPQSP